MKVPDEADNDPVQTMEPSAASRERLIAGYFETTSGSAHDAAPASYAVRTRGLSRGLGVWLDVAGKSVVDLGCGVGELCWLAREAGATAIDGVNLSAGELEFARREVDAEFHCQDILAYLAARPDASVDRIFALNILEHLDHDMIVAVLEQARRCLAPGGTLVAMVPNATSPFGTMTRYWDFTHRLAFTPSSVHQLMRLCDFDRADFREWGPRVHGMLSAIRFVLWQAMRLSIWFRLVVETGSGKGGVYTSDMLFRLARQSDPSG